MINLKVKIPQGLPLCTQVFLSHQRQLRQYMACFRELATKLKVLNFYDATMAKYCGVLKPVMNRAVILPAASLQKLG